MLKRPILILTAASLVVWSLIAAAPMVQAATTSNPVNAGQALEIAPPIINLTVNPGQTISVSIYLRDVSKTNLIVTGEADDFIAAGEDGTPKLLLDGSSDDPYSMKTWVSSLPSLTLIPREIKAMTITLKVPKEASPGGHYGVIRFTATPPDLKDTGVSLSASLGALMLVTVTGQINENLAVQEFSVNQNGYSGWLFETPPVDFVERFKNTGNIHEQPSGQVTVTDMFGHVFAGVNINAPPTNVLPDSIRRYSQPLDSSVIGDNKMFGHYTASLKITYGSTKKVLTAQVSFWVIPYRLIGAVVVGAIAAFFILRFIIRRYNRHIIAQSQRTRRR